VLSEIEGVSAPQSADTHHNVIHLRTVEASALLGIGPNVLREWEQHLGFPTSRPAPDGHRQFVWAEILALRHALLSEHSVAAAIAVARASLADGNAEALRDAFLARDGRRCGQALESALNVGSLEGTIEDVLVRALDLLARMHGPASREWGFAAEFAAAWLRRTSDETRPLVGGGSILLGDATRDELDADHVYISALALLCRRIGCTIRMVPVRAAGELREEAEIAQPDVLLIAGGQASDAIVLRWAHATRRTVLPAMTALYRRDPRPLRFLTSADTALPPDPLAARARLIELIDEAHSVA
jgi:hypothetical protein